VVFLFGLFGYILYLHLIIKQKLALCRNIVSGFDTKVDNLHDFGLLIVRGNTRSVLTLDILLGIISTTIEIK